MKLSSLLQSLRTRSMNRRKSRRLINATPCEALEERVLLAADLIRDINTTPNHGGSSRPGEFVTIGNTVYFTATTATTGAELWKSDGTETGTVLVKDVRNGSRSSAPRYLTNVNGTLFFGADDGTNAVELWKSDGTVACHG